MAGRTISGNIQHSTVISSCRILLCSLLAGLLLGACSGADRARGPVVLAPSSMADVIEDLADAWEAKGHARPVLSLAGTPSLARQVEAGAPADVVISADEQWMDWLEGRALVDPASRRTIAGNALVYVMHDVPADAEVAAGQKVPLYGGKLAMADPETVPAGRYARAALEAAGLWAGVKDAVVPTENVRAALVLVQRGEAQTGIVYASDAATADELGAIGFQHPLPDGLAIRYPAARVTGSTHGDATVFLDFLASNEVATIICARGFTMPEGRTPC